MLITNIYEAKTHLSSLINKVLNGEEVVIAKAGKPLVELVPFSAEKEKVKFGLLRDKISIADNFDSFDDQVADMFTDYLPEDN